MTIFENVMDRIDTVAEVLGLSDNDKEYILKHKRVSHATLKVNGKEYDAWRILHNDDLGPGKGGIRYHPNVSEDEVKSLSFWMSIKNSLAGLPYGGAKGGIKVNPKELTKDELQELSRKYVDAFADVLGDNIDIPAPDVNTNAEVMGWMLDEYEKVKGAHAPATFTGKPLELGGLETRNEATGFGGWLVLREMMNLKCINQKMYCPPEHEHVTVAVQGFGNVGKYFAKYAYMNGLRIVAVSDSKGAVYNPDGLEINKLIEHKQETGALKGFKNSKDITNEELLELKVDVVAPAALENQITEDNADKIKADMILELANGPVNSKADKILKEKGVTVIPDILANAGGVVSSYQEWVNNKLGNYMDKEDVLKLFEKIMVDAAKKVYIESSTKNTDLRTAAYMLAIQRILKAKHARGR
ncbi:Glu/Leu/Phe/Val dehydrogenase [Candidatus Micrarchaeota archaeon]|nr:Glu/Leu/Phe/Val dehydrogenase [Candidatus Micrarchaeota archaeon]